MSARDAFPPSRAEVYALGLLGEPGKRDRLVLVPASILAGLCADIELWRDMVSRSSEKTLQ
jgi:hypothetical protein